MKYELFLNNIFVHLEKEKLYIIQKILLDTLQFYVIRT